MASAGLRFCGSLGNPPNHCRHFVYCTILLAIEVSCFLFLVAGTHGLIVPLDAPTSTDFVSFYAAGSLADAGTPELAYDQAAHNAAEEQATAPGVEYRFFYYPPVFLLLCALVARLPYLVAFLIFEAVTLAVYLIVMSRILGKRSFAALVPVLAFPAMFWVGTERISHCGVVRSGDALHRPSADHGGSAFRCTLLQAAFRPAGSGSACRRGPLACVRCSSCCGRCTLFVLSDAVRLGDMERFSVGRRSLACDL